MRNQLLQKKTAVLKRYEAYSYQIAYYLLEDEDLAQEAAARVLTALYQDDGFFHHSNNEQKHMVKRVSMKQSLALKASCLILEF